MTDSVCQYWTKNAYGSGEKICNYDESHRIEINVWSAWFVGWSIDIYYKWEVIRLCYVLFVVQTILSNR